MNHSLQLGIDKCLREPPPCLNGARIGLLVNRASVDQRLRSTCDLFHERFGSQLISLFTPQHGMWGCAQANMVETPHGESHELQIPVYSLYSETREPTEAMLAPLDCFVIDLQDVGTRVYTFVWTMQACLHACASAGLDVVILDRPNPLGGSTVEGPMLQPSFISFVGGAGLPMRHGMTMGELATWLNVEIGARLSVVNVERWNWESMADDATMPWVPPSPNMPTLQTVALYPGQVLLEGTNLSEGRGTTTPFEVVGAPFIDAHRLCHEIQQLELGGVTFLPLKFKPTFDKWSQQVCGGVSIHITNSAVFRSYRMSVQLIGLIRSLWPEHFEWIDPPYEYESELPPIDIIAGSDTLRRSIDQMKGFDADLLEPAIEVDVDEWRRVVGQSLLYGTCSRFSP